jgi:hypothetical protein
MQFQRSLSRDVYRNFTKGEIMKMQKVMLALVGMTFLFAGIASAQQIKTDYDRSANFALCKTYSWEHVETKDPLNVDRIKHAVNAALAARGWMQVDSGADVSIVAMEITRDQQTLNTFLRRVWGRLGLETLWWRRFWRGNDHDRYVQGGHGSCRSLRYENQVTDLERSREWHALRQL